MSNLERTFKKSNVIARLEDRVEILEQVEMRQMLALGCYEAVAGELDVNLLQKVNDMLHNKSFKSRQEMYIAIRSCATVVLSELEFERASAELDARTAAESTQGSESAPAAETQSSASDTSDK